MEESFYTAFNYVVYSEIGSSNSLIVSYYVMYGINIEYVLYSNNKRAKEAWLFYSFTKFKSYS